MEADREMAMLAALAIGGYLAALFIVFAHRIGALADFGRRPLDNRRFLALGAAAFVPGVGCLAALGLVCVDELLAQPAVLALGMSGAAIAGRAALRALESAVGWKARSGASKEG